jgi:hypothetical protein
MFDQVVAEGQLLARTILFDSRYAGSTPGSPSSFAPERSRRAHGTFFGGKAKLAVCIQDHEVAKLLEIHGG